MSLGRRLHGACWAFSDWFDDEGVYSGYTREMLESIMGYCQSFLD